METREEYIKYLLDKIGKVKAKQWGGVIRQMKIRQLKCLDELMR